MRVRARLGAAFSAVTAVLTVFLMAVPAHAGGHGGDLDTLAPFNRAGEGTDWLAIAIVMAVLTAVVLGSATVAANAFKPKK